MTSVYLSGPMSKYPDFNYPEFNRVAGILRNQGFEVFNPAELFGGKGSLPVAFYMRENYAMILKAHGLVMLPGWKDSVGACHERLVAEDLGLPIWEWREP